MLDIQVKRKKLCNSYWMTLGNSLGLWSAVLADVFRVAGQKILNIWWSSFCRAICPDIGGIVQE